MAVAVIALLAVAGGAFVVSQRASTENNAIIPEDQQLVPVSRGDLIQEISITGSLSLPNRETLTFGSSGVIAEIRAQEGDKVTEGQTLAVLDQEDIAALEEAVVQAKVALRDAVDALEDYTTPSELDIARARKDVADAEVNLQSAVDALEDLANPSPVAISSAEARIVSYQVDLDNLEEPPTQLEVDQAEKNVAGARLELERARDNLEDAQETPTQLEMDQAEKNVAGARLELERAQDDLEETRTADSDEIRNARNNVDSAKRELAYSWDELDVVQREWEVKLTEAQSDLEDKAEAYAEAFAKWLGISAGPASFDPDYEVALSDLGVNLEFLFDLSARFSDLEEGGYYSDGPPADDPSTAWNETTVFVWLNLSPTEIAVMCEPGDAPPGGVCIEDEFRARSKSYVSALDSLDETEVQSDKSLSAAKTGYDRAQHALNTAETALEELTEPTEAVIADMTAAVQLAESRLEDAERELRELAEPTEAVIADMTAAVQLAESRLEDAERELRELAEPEDDLPSERNRRAQADLARANVEQAKDDLADLLDGQDKPEYAALLQGLEVARRDLEEKRKDLQELIEPDPESLDLAVLQVNVASARVALSQAEQRLVDAAIIAPFDGFVSKLDVEEGDEVERHTNIMVVVDTSVVELDGGVDEIDVLKTQIGAKASVEIDALPDQPVTGDVFSIAAEPESGSGQASIVSYPVTIRLSVPDGVDLPAGLSAVASIVISEERDALLVPLDALRGQFDSPTLHVMRDGEIVETPVTLGSSDDFLTVVTSGVEEGDMIVTRAPEGSEVEFDIGGGPDDGDEPPRRRQQ